MGKKLKFREWQFLPTTQLKPEGFFRLGQSRGRTWLVSPKGDPFFSIGFNHIDPAFLSPQDQLHHGQEKQGREIHRWLSERVGPEVQSWGFNSVGNTVKIVSNESTQQRKARRLTFEEYQSLGLPYCHQLDFAGFYDEDAPHRLPDFFASEFEDWCDHVARKSCADMAGDPLLIGYFYLDFPGWFHPHPHIRWRGPMFDYQKLGTKAGRRELLALASRYYQVTHDAIRRYDKHHLILGDRYEARDRMAEQVLQAAKPYVDVLSFQYHGNPAKIRKDLTHWAKTIGLPTLLVDSMSREESPVRSYDTQVYAEVMKVSQEMDHCLGFHLCGGYTQTQFQHAGFVRTGEKPFASQVIDAIVRTNKAARQWVQLQ
jgi:hypothetical protein